MVMFKKYVEVGRIALIRSGRFRGKVCAIVDIVDQNRVLVHGPRTGVPRTDVTLKRILLTGMKMRLNRACAGRELAKSWKDARVTQKWKKSYWGKALVAQKKKRAMTDFDRFKLMRARQARNRIIKQEIIFLKKKYEPKRIKKRAEWVAKMKARKKVKQTPIDPETQKLKMAEKLKEKLLFIKRMKRKRKKEKRRKEEEKEKRRKEKEKAKAAKEAGLKPGKKKVPKLRGKKAKAAAALQAKRIATGKAKGAKTGPLAKRATRLWNGAVRSRRMLSLLRGPRTMVLHKKQIRSMILRGTRSSLPKRKKLEKPEVKPDGKYKKPGDKKAGDKKPGDKKAGDKKPGDKKAGDKKPGDKKAGDKPGDKKAGDKKPGDKKAGDKPGDKKAGDKKAGDKPGDKKAGDKKPGDKKAGDKKPRDKKPAEKSGDKKPGDEKSGDKKPGAEPDSKP